jgi:ribosomal protein S6
MPLYEAVFLVNAKASLPTVARVMKQKATCIFEHGGVLRRLDNLGIIPLSYPMYRNREKHYKGRWILMLFDSSSKCQRRLTELLRTDAEVIRWLITRENDVFREKYDELRIHGGAFRREIDSTKIDDERLEDLDEAMDLQRLLNTDRFAWAPAAETGVHNLDDIDSATANLSSLIDTKKSSDRLSPLEALFEDFQKKQ